MTAQGSTLTTTVPQASPSLQIPAGAVGIVGITYIPTTAPTYPVTVNLNLAPDSTTPFQSVLMLCWKGTKSAWGFMPLNPSSVIQVAITFITAQANSPAEAGVANVDIIFAVSTNASVAQGVPFSIPFQADNGQMNETGCTVTQTSATTTSQTVDIAPTQGVEYELTQAWYYAGAAIAVTMNAYDGTTAVPIASPASATSADLTPAGPRRSITGGLSTTIMFRVSAAAPGAGTSTVYVSFVARIKK